MTDLSDFDDDADAEEFGSIDEVTEVAVERLVAGGVALARRDDGRIVLVDDGLPGERCRVEVSTRRGADRGRVLEVLDASPDRIEPRCAEIERGCGGCDLATLGTDAQIDAKREMVVDSLRRVGRWAEPVVDIASPLDPWAFRTTMRFGVVDGRLALRARGSHELIGIERCEIAHPLVQEIIDVGTFEGCDEVTVRVGATTGERMVRCSPNASDVDVPADVRVIGVDELRSGRRSWFHDDVDDRHWRISADSFFQTRADGAAALIDVVSEMAADVLERPEGVLIDACCGVGLFAGALLADRPGWSAVAAERSRSSIADARVNLADLDVQVIATDVEQMRAPSADVVVADPSRAGLGRRAIRTLTRLDPERFILVSCDPAAAGRDLALLVEAGYRPVRSVLVDLFPHTRHVEVVSRFDRVEPG